MTFIFLYFIFALLPTITSKTTMKMLKMFGTVTGSPESTTPLLTQKCIDRCFNDRECMVASWQTGGNCHVYKLVLPHSRSQQTIQIVESKKDKKQIVAVKSQLTSTICPSLKSPIPGSITPPQQLKAYPVTYNWTRMSTGWSIKQCSACVLSRTKDLHICVKLHDSEQLHANYVGGFTQPDAVTLSGWQQKKLLGLASIEEISFVFKSRSIQTYESFWIDGRGSNCANGKCTKITWSDGWTTTSTIKTIDTTVTNPCLAVINGQVVGRDCNEKMRGALCAWKLP